MPRRGLDTDGLSLRAQPCRRRGEHYFACVVGQRLGLWLVNPYRVGHDLVDQFRGPRSHYGPAVDELPLADTGRRPGSPMYLPSASKLADGSRVRRASASVVVMPLRRRLAPTTSDRKDFVPRFDTLPSGLVAVFRRCTEPSDPGFATRCPSGLSEEWSAGLDGPQRLFTQPARGPRGGGLPTPVRGARFRWGFRRRRRRRATRAPWPRRSSRRVRTGPNPPQSRPPRRGAG